MQIRPAVEADLDVIARVQARTMVASDYYDDSVDEELEFRRLRPRVGGYFHGTYHPSYALAERSIFVADHDAQVNGFIAGHRSNRMGCTGELQWMFVLPHRQRKGIGAALLRPMAEWFRDHASTKVIVDAPPANPYCEFYLKHGAVALDAYWLYFPNIGHW